MSVEFIVQQFLNCCTRSRGGSSNSGNSNSNKSNSGNSSDNKSCGKEVK